MPRRILKQRASRKGATAVEFAVVVPIVILLILCAVMFSGVLMTQNTLTAAARAGGRVACLSSVTSDNAVVAAVKDRLQQGGVDPDQATIDVTPSDLSSVNAGDEISVTVSIPMNQTTWWQWGDIPESKNLVSEISFIRE